MQSGVDDSECVLFIVQCELCCCNMLQSKFFFLTLNIILIVYFSQWMLCLNSDNKMNDAGDLCIYCAFDRRHSSYCVCFESGVTSALSTVGSVTKGIWLVKTSVSRTFYSSSFTTPTGFLSSWHRVIPRKSVSNVQKQWSLDTETGLVQQIKILLKNALRAKILYIFMTML